MSECCELEEAAGVERRTLQLLLGLNFAMFFVELGAGWWGNSTGLLADSLDMLADAMVYGIALYAVGRSTRIKADAASASGWFQLILGVVMVVEVLRRFRGEIEPSSAMMMAVGLLALVANVTCLALIAKHRTSGIHMRSSWVCANNDVLANLGVIVSGGLVWLSGSRVPDLVIGALISAVVIRSAIGILREAKEARGVGV